jgi:hypothetical protein
MGNDVDTGAEAPKTEPPRGYKRGLDPRRERFCQAIVDGASLKDAYLVAGYDNRDPSNGANIMIKHPLVKARISQLSQAKALARLEETAPPEDEKPTREWVIRKWMAAVRMSEIANDRSNLIKGVEALAKLEGYMIDRTEIRSGPLDGLSASQLQTLIAFIDSQRAITVDAAHVRVVSEPGDTTSGSLSKP